LGNSSADSAGPSTRLLSAGETPPYSVRNPGASSPILLIGDHAGREIPAGLNGLDLPPAALDLHIACDIGVAALGAQLADALDATFIAQRFSRLVIDCNRDPARSDAIAEVSDGVAVPANADLPPEARAQRTREIFEPYHARIADEIAARRQAGQPTILLALHSFTPVMAGAARPWRFGVLHLGGSRFSDAMLRALRRGLGADLVGDNEPYRMDGTDYTVPRHAIGNGIDYLELEVRQDLISHEDGRAEFTALLVPLFRSLA
jgi:predicted N-formylglutamate amidohydrolase